MAKTIKGVSLTALKKRQHTAMTKHSKHHTDKHIKSLVAHMKKGKTFNQSHMLTLKKIGK